MFKNIYELLEELRVTTNPVTRSVLMTIITDRMKENKIPELAQEIIS